MSCSRKNICFAQKNSSLGIEAYRYVSRVIHIMLVNAKTHLFFFTGEIKRKQSSKFTVAIPVLSDVDNCA